MNTKVGIIMGSDSDYEVVKGVFEVLKHFDVGYEAKVCSAHRTPHQASDYAGSAKERGIMVLIAAAGKAAHLPGVLAAFTTLPVIGLPIKSSFMDGLDSLLSIAQMPGGVPVATVAVNGSRNAALLAIQILALSDEKLSEKMTEYKKNMELAVLKKDKKLQKLLNEKSQDQ